MCIYFHFIALPIVFEDNDQLNSDVATEIDGNIAQEVCDLPEIGGEIELAETIDVPVRHKRPKKIPNREGIMLGPSLIDVPRRRRTNTDYDVGSGKYWNLIPIFELIITFSNQNVFPHSHKGKI